MVEERQARYAVGAWEPALEAVFSRHASAKLAYTGRLDINDYTQDGFYVQKRLIKTLAPLSELLQRRGPARGPVYVANFQTVCTSESPVVVPDDENLRSYVLRLSLRLDEQLTSAETSPIGYDVNYSLQKSTREKAEILGEFVAQQLSGLTRDRDCSAPAVDCTSPSSWCLFP
ncbi:hypothetical protein EVAR_62050_1 [Eumeta japonica]|uniref:Uncharacterized protein n=1 Tax=Eumeta variegata TaxID=151549 RepID=A0A4C1YTU2_EUMVA|nr:hypothetical protein EVAR_62050_1 [Eumeta japonica]